MGWFWRYQNKISRLPETRKMCIVMIVQIETNILSKLLPWMCSASCLVLQVKLMKLDFKTSRTTVAQVIVWKLTWHVDTASVQTIKVFGVFTISGGKGYQREITANVFHEFSGDVFCHEHDYLMAITAYSNSSTSFWNEDKRIRKIQYWCFQFWWRPCCFACIYEKGDTCIQYSSSEFGNILVKKFHIFKRIDILVYNLQLMLDTYAWNYWGIND